MDGESTPSASTPENTHEIARQGLLYGLLAYGWWGLIPLYFKTVDHIPPLEVLAHRVVWSCAILTLVITISRRWSSFRRALSDRRALATLAVTTLLIATNWFTYIYAIGSGNVLQASLGYFITPLANVLLGVVFLQERIGRLQILAVAIAVVGVVTLALLGGAFPWIAMTLAVSFSFYGLLRKTVAVDGLVGLFIETLFLLPPALGAIAVLTFAGQGAFRLDTPGVDGLLILGGVVTTIPLLSFAAAARRLRLSTLGFLQYLAPTIQFLLAIVAFGEPFSRWQIASFGCIWMAIALYTLDSLVPYLRAQALFGSAVPTPTIDTPVADAIDGL
jgi:chloramphenicol-sensitive protein RarD